jgi:hypothetical protein
MSCVVSASEVVARAHAQVQVVAVNMHTLYPTFTYYPHKFFFLPLADIRKYQHQKVWPKRPRGRFSSCRKKNGPTAKAAEYAVLYPGATLLGMHPACSPSWQDPGLSLGTPHLCPAHLSSVPKHSPQQLRGNNQRLVAFC